jgi:hypothetical protein
VSRKNNSLSLNAIDGELLPEELTYQSKIRSAIFDGVKVDDAKEIVQQIVAKAKTGDPKAQKLFFDYLAGFATAPTKITVVNQFPSVEAAANAARSRRLKGTEEDGE